MNTNHPPLGARLLSQQEVNKLKDGTKVNILWPSGGAAKTYTFAHMGREQEVYALTDVEVAQKRLIHEYTLDDVGYSDTQQRVWVSADTIYTTTPRTPPFKLG